MFNHNKFALILIGIILLGLLFGCTTREIPSDGSFNNLDKSNEIQIDSKNLEVHYIDVGQGDCILIKLPNSETFLIDAGGSSAANTVVDYLKNQGIKKLDHVVGTHPHEDHIGGLDVVIKSFNIGKVYLPRVSHTSKSFEDLLLAIKEKGLKVTEAKGGVEVNVGEEARVVFVAPNNSSYQDLNNYSAVVKLIYGETGFLFTGDAEEKSESEMLLQSRTPLNANVLKVGHHGSVTSTSQPFLNAVSPSFAVIPVGKSNDYGHPHREIIERLEDNNVQYFRTDFQGTIIAISDGKEISFNNEPFTNTSDGHSIAKDVKILSIDLQKEVVVIQNTGKIAVNMSGWKLVSVKGKDEFYFPENFMLQSGGLIKIASGPKAIEKSDTIPWTDKFIWNNDGDPGILYDEKGQIVSELP